MRDARFPGGVERRSRDDFDSMIIDPERRDSARNAGRGGQPPQRPDTDHASGGLSFPDLLEPVLDAAEADDDAFDDAVNEVAEALALCEALVLDNGGRPGHGVTDEEAVLSALDTYIRVLLHLGEVQEAADLGDVMERLHTANERRRRPRRR
jgi:hypothetical protein